MNLFQFPKYLSIALISLVLMGCTTTTVPLSHADRAAIKTVAVAQRVESVHGLDYGSLNAKRASLVLGALPVMMIASADHHGEKFEAEIKQSHLSIPSIVRSSFIRQLQAQRVFQVGGQARPDATISLNITKYAITPGSFSYSKVLPSVSVQAVMRNRRGKVIWKSRAISAKNKAAEQKPDYLLQHPELLRKGFRIAADTAARNLVKRLVS